MRHWDVGIFGGDFESAILVAYKHLRGQGFNPSGAAAEVFAEFLEGTNDLIYGLGTVALAAAMIRSDELNEEWRWEALDSIKAAHFGDYLLWSTSDPKEPTLQRPCLSRHHALRKFGRLLTSWSSESAPPKTIPHYLHVTSPAGCTECILANVSENLVLGALAAEGHRDILAQVRDFLRAADSDRLHGDFWSKENDFDE